MSVNVVTMGIKGGIHVPIMKENAVTLRESRHTGEVEKSRSKWVTLLADVAMVCSASVAGVNSLMVKAYAYPVTTTVASVTDPANQIRHGFMQIMDVFTAIAEPILWMYALMGCIMMATGKNKDMGWSRIKQVGYAYIGIILLPTFFSFLRWVAGLLGGAMHF